MNLSRSWETSITTTRALVDKLSHNLSPEEYRSAMYNLGLIHGQEVAAEVNTDKVCVACTVEDADYLAKGIIDSLSDSGKSVSIACFWNKRIKVGSGIPDTAPILKQFIDEDVAETEVLVVVKSIISGACVVKTNLTHLIEKSDPQRIFIAAPVIRKGAEERLSREFPDRISSKFNFKFFAVDSEVDSVGNVIPGIGGSVYENLGFGSEDLKNKLLPDLIKKRLLGITFAGV